MCVCNVSHTHIHMYMCVCARMYICVVRVSLCIYIYICILRYAVVGESDDAEGDNDVRYSMAKPLLETRTPLSRALKAQIFTSSIKDLVPHYSKDVPLLESGVKFLLLYY
jgi:hypothetical protein